MNARWLNQHVSCGFLAPQGWNCAIMNLAVYIVMEQRSPLPFWQKERNLCSIVIYYLLGYKPLTSWLWVSHPLHWKVNLHIKGKNFLTTYSFFKCQGLSFNPDPILLLWKTKQNYTFFFFFFISRLLLAARVCEKSTHVKPKQNPMELIESSGCEVVHKLHVTEIKICCFKVMRY